MNKSINIINAIVSGNRVAFRQMYDLFADKVYNTALSYVKNERDAEEITQDVFVRIFNNASKFKGEASLSTWIYRITINTSLNYIKKKKRFAFLKFGELDKNEADFEHPGVLLENKEHSKLLFRVIDTLPDSQKTAFILSFIEELPRQEVADIMETSLKAVESLLQRAKKNLRGKLEEIYPNRKKKKK